MQYVIIFLLCCMGSWCRMAASLEFMVENLVDLEKKCLGFHKIIKDKKGLKGSH